MFVWTKKAEDDFRAKYPKRPLLRKEGHEVIWEGKPLGIGSIMDGYIARGWIAEDGKIKRAAKPVCNLGKVMPIKEQVSRWKKLQRYLSQPKVSMREVAVKMGYRSTTPLGDFVTKYGVDLAAKYGKLPYVRNIKKKSLLTVMEPKPE